MRKIELCKERTQAATKLSLLVVCILSMLGVQPSMADTAETSEKKIEQPKIEGVKFTKIQDLDPNKAGPNRPIKQKWAVVIGISNFKEKRLKTDDFYMVKSAKDFKDYLVDPKGGRFDEQHVRLLTNHNATKGNIISTLGEQWLGPLAKPEDLVVVYLTTNSFPTTDGSAYLCTYDCALDNIYGTCISIKDVMATLKKNVKAERIVLVLQSPYSGAAQLEGEAKALTKNFNIDPNNLITGKGFIIVSSSKPDQLSWSNIFSTYLIEELRKKDGLISLGEAFNEARKKTEYETTHSQKNLSLQTPVMKTDWQGQDLVIGAPAVEEAMEIPQNIQGYLAAEAHYFRANEFVTKGQLDNAITEYEKAISTDPSYGDALADYATVLALKEQYEKASELYQRAISVRPQDSLYRVNYAQVLARLGQTQESINQLEEAYKLNSKDREVLTALATISLKNEEPDRAVDLLTQAIELYPNSSKLHNSISYAFARAGNMKYAINHAQKAVLLDPKSVTARLNLGSMSMAYGNVENAVKSYEEAISLDPANATAHYLLSQSLDKAGKKDKAQAELKKYVDLAPETDPLRQKALDELNTQ